MDVTPDEARSAGIAANMAGRFDEAYRLLLPLAEAGDAEIQGIVGGLVIAGFHRRKAGKASTRLRLGPNWSKPVISSGPHPTRASARRRSTWRPCSSWGTATGRGRSVGHARPNCTALAHAQGFTAFGYLMQGEGRGEPYLSMLEKYASSAGCPLPGESEPGD